VAVQRTPHLLRARNTNKKCAKDWLLLMAPQCRELFTLTLSGSSDATMHAAKIFSALPVKKRPLLL
jgi:hypothetical protein